MGAAILNADEIASQFSESLRTIAKLQGFSEKVVTLAEVGVVLKTCAGRTKVAKPDGIELRTKGRVLRSLNLTNGKLNVTINSGLRRNGGRVWANVRNLERGKNNGSAWLLAGQMSDDAQKFTPTKYHFKNQLWWDIRDSVNEYATKYRRALPMAKDSAGLARQSWIQMADDLGIILEDIPGGGASPAAIAKARRAMASNGQKYQNGIGNDEGKPGESYFAVLTNRLPYWPKLKFDTMILTVLNGRTQYFQKNVENAVFASHAQTVRAYPWLKLVGAEAA